MNYTNLFKQLILGVGILSTSFILGTESINADSRVELQTVNLVEVQKSTISNKVSDEDKTSTVLATIDINNASINIFGGQFERAELEPLVIILDCSEVPDGEGVCNSANFTYMDYRAVTNKRSRQYALLNAPEAYTDEETGIRMYDGRICIAVGSFYADHIGTKINLIMENGSIIECILGDGKADVHTDPTNRYQAYDGSVAEIIVDRRVFRGTNMYPEQLKGKISKIEIVD